MHSVTFVIQASSDKRNRLALCAHLLQYWLAQGLSPYCLTPDQDYANFLDDFLWSEDSIFIPHTQSAFQSTRIQAYIGTKLPHTHHHIFNCTQQAIDLSNQKYALAIVEWVSQNTADKAHMRTVFSHYKTQHQVTPITIRLDA